MPKGFEDTALRVPEDILPLPPPAQADDEAGQNRDARYDTSPPAAAAEQAAGAWIPPALRRLDAAAAAAGGGGVPRDVLDAWAAAYRQMTADARNLGIPASAIPPLPARPDAAQLRAARDRLAGIMASFESAGL